MDVGSRYCIGPPYSHFRERHPFTLHPPPPNVSREPLVLHQRYVRSPFRPNPPETQFRILSQFR